MTAALLLAALAAAAPLDPGDLPLPDANPRVKRPPAERFGTSAFRANLAAGPAAASSRVALVQDLDGPFLGELTLRGHVAWQAFALSVEVAGTAGASEVWSSVGLGNTVLDARILFGRGSTHAIGLRGTFPTGDRLEPLGPVAWWGTVPQATVPTTGLALAYEGATRRWVWHVRAGLRTDPFWATAYTEGIFDVGALLATVQPVAERWEVVAEVEALTGPSPLHVRALARQDLGRGWTVDAGLAVPVVAFVVDPSVQAIGRLERRW